MTGVKLPLKRDVVARMGDQPEKWAGMCHQASLAVVEEMAKLGQSAVVRRGWFQGQTVPGAYFHGRPCQHSWVELPDGRVLDPTRFAFVGGPAWPLWIGPDDEYDVCGCRQQAPSSPPPHASESKSPLVELRFAEDGDDAARGIVQAVAWQTGIGGYCARITKQVIEVSVQQVFWLGNLPIKDTAELGTLPRELAEEVYTAIVRADLGSAIPIDRRDWILGDGGALYGRQPA